MQVNSNSMMAHSAWMNANANNIANVNTTDFNASSTTIQSSAKDSLQAVSSLINTQTDLAKEMSEQIPIEKGFSAQATAIKTQEEMIGSLLDLPI